MPWVIGLTVLCLVVGLVWGFFFTPDDYKQGSTVKIIYLHVPSAMMAINAWVMMLEDASSGRYHWSIHGGEDNTRAGYSDPHLGNVAEWIVARVEPVPGEERGLRLPGQGSVQHRGKILARRRHVFGMRTHAEGFARQFVAAVESLHPAVRAGQRDASGPFLAPPE